MPRIKVGIENNCIYLYITLIIKAHNPIKCFYLIKIPET